MVQYIHFRNPNSPEMAEALKSLPKCPGTCIFIDIVSSTEVKYTSDIEEWGKKLNNTFNFISFLNHFPEYVVKGIGDEMMIYIPDDVLKARHDINNYYVLLEEMYSTILNLKKFPVKDLFYNCKLSMHYCTEVYNITFLKGLNDYYGRDVDLAARLMTKTQHDRLVFSEAFLKKVQNDLKKHKVDKKDTCLQYMSVKMVDLFKGVPKPVEYRYIDVD